MIKLDPPQPPAALKEQIDKWSAELAKQTYKCGSFEEISAAERKKILQHYKHKAIKALVFAVSHKKCAYCERKPANGGGNIEVEHFYPKSLYPELSFQLNNLLPACRKCNGSKSNHDVKKEPILNPYVDNPEDYIEFLFCELTYKNDKTHAIVDTTIEVCNLNSTELVNCRAQALGEFNSLLIVLKNKIRQYKFTDNKEKIIRELKNIIEDLEYLAAPDKCYSAFIKYHVFDNKYFQEAKKLVCW